MQTTLDVSCLAIIYVDSVQKFNSSKEQAVDL